MIEHFSTEKTKTKQSRLLLRIYLLMAVLVVVVVGAMGYNFYVSYHTVRLHHPQLKACMSARNEITRAHLWLEEVLSIDRYEDPAKVWNGFEKAQWYIDALLDGGKDDHYNYRPLQREQDIENVNEIRKNLNRLINKSRERLEENITPAEILSLDHEYDEAFLSINNELINVENTLNEYISLHWGQFQRTKIGLISITILSFVLAGFEFRHLINRLMKDELKTIQLNQEIESTNQQLEASNQQLKASQQQLEASNQQLKASQQQLQASQQQLKAANQQLTAANQQLTATNQELVSSEDKRNELIRQLESRNEELQNVVYIASHDLRSPLVNIKGFSAELNRSCKELQNSLRLVPSEHPEIEKINNLIKEEMPESLKFISSSANSMEMLISGLLRVSRIGTSPIKIQIADTDKIVTDVVNNLEYEIKDKDIKIDVQQNLPPCMADRGQLNQIFSNLLSNAIKYLDNDHTGKINVTGKKESGKVLYCVEDNGIGIESEHQGQIFNIFHRLNPSGSVTGDGLGLTIVKRIIDRNGGEIWLDSQPGKGSKFFFRLPLAT
jgi:signal transduction histidine kinase